MKISAAIVDELKRQAESAYPEECCGLLLGISASGEVREPFAAKNLAEHPADHYIVDPRAIMDADRQARDRGLDIIGVYHSHPDHAAIPSATDLEAAWEAYVYVIVEVRAGAVRDFRAWKVVQGTFQEVTIL